MKKTISLLLIIILLSGCYNTPSVSYLDVTIQQHKTTMKILNLIGKLFNIVVQLGENQNIIIERLEKLEEEVYGED